MNRSNLRAAQREKYSATDVLTGIPKGNETAKLERKRMSDWLARRGDPTRSYFLRRKTK
jgi:hypothetical protein